MASITLLACGSEKEKSVSEIIESKDIKEIKTKRNTLLGDVKLLENAISK